MSDVKTNNEERIRERAHDLWEQDGRPEGRADEYWHRAELEIETEESEHEEAEPPISPKRARA